MKTTNSRRIAALVIAAVAISVLAGCTPEPTPTNSTTASPTPSDTATGFPAPESESEAIDNAERTIATFLKLRGEVNAAGGEDTSGLETIATGPALRLALDDAARVIELKWKTEGALVFEPENAYAVDLVDADGKAFSFSSVNVTGCQDGSNFKVFNSDGTAAQQPAPRNELEFNVIWDPTVELWLVNTVIATGATC
jgi:hypothetical protein